MRPRRARFRSALVLAVLAVAVVAGCGGDDGDPDAAPKTTEAADSPGTTAAPEPLRILLVNDDGIVNPAIDVMLALLAADDEVEITVVAPAEERSGSSDKVTVGGATYQESTTPGGVKGYAVNGYPADAVAVGLDELDLDPHLVVSGVNPGQNVGPLAAVSGTVGVGRTAIRRGVPALAVSAGLTFDEEQFAFAAGLARDWIGEHRTDLVAGSHQTDTVTSINVPACPVDEMGELQDVTRATELPEGVDVFASSCDLSDPAPATDIAALVVGFPSITQVPADL
jgi:5'-nucleotidase